MYAAIAGLKTHQSKMDVIGNNISNCNTYGYKSSRAAFQEAMYTTTSHAAGGTNSFGGTNAAQVGYGCKLASIDKLFEASTPAATGKPSDVMITGNGFFLVGNKLPTGVGGVNPEQGSTENGDVANQQDITSLLLTRVGNFGVDEDGFIVDSQGYVVYGFTYPEAQQVYPIPEGASISYNNLMPLRVPLQKADGTNVQGDDGKPPEVTIAFDPSGTVTAKVAGGETIVVEAFQPGDGNTGRLQPSCLEMANVDIANEFAEMITTQRGFQANTRIVTVTDQMLEELVSMKR